MEGKKLRSLRNEYGKAELSEKAAPVDPMVFFGQWMREAIETEVPEPTAMVLSTVGREGKPSSRIVLLKDYDQRGFMFFTNYHSRKGEELGYNPAASLLLFWEPLQRQVRMEGQVDFLSEEESDLYFKSRPIESQISAIVSPQSSEVASREELERLWDKFRNENEGEEVKRQNTGGATCWYQTGWSSGRAA